ncbi:pyocin knob domain-containing protein [Bacteroides muris (ex Fokt et al. 2023)]|uniref:Pyocin knob domain-containing protein n=1 Tax=Bacteroides muris (ex Fokt et al. 2023) TaxID=2937417 RepID=A0A9X2NUJ7_9BACE|nr:pyocin knob domain-containing protein [Bacteroides muris (ex Fokt et al. 2023)]MCR6506143.1 pyocin knob domain-containing protein [Bacteroides muris (ex Fokt et al. 2023)]
MAEKQDIREDQMTVSSSVGYLRGLKGKDSVLIAPSNLLSEMFQYRGDVSDNYDNFIENGIFQIYSGSNVTNAPDGISFGFLLVFKTKFYLAQIALEVRPGNIAVKLRTNSGPAWSGWKSVTLT